MAQTLQRPAVGVVRYYNFLPEGASFLGEVLAGLSRPQKSLPSGYLYDARGGALFEQLRALPEYHSARAEPAILREHAAAIAALLGPACQLIEFGRGAGEGARLLIEQLQPPLYLPVAVDAEAMQTQAAALAQAYPWLNIAGIRADVTGPLTLPGFVGVSIQKKAVYLSAACIGGLLPEQALAALRLARRLVGAGGVLLAAADASKAAPGAYDDAAGLNAAFRLNLLARVNRELGADFQLRRFRQRASYAAGEGWIELRLESLASQFVHVGGRRITFAQGETLHIETRRRYRAVQLRELAQRAGFAPGESWSDAANTLSVHAMLAV